MKRSENTRSRFTLVCVAIVLVCGGSALGQLELVRVVSPEPYEWGSFGSAICCDEDWLVVWEGDSDRADGDRRTLHFYSLDSGEPVLTQTINIDGPEGSWVIDIDDGTVLLGSDQVADGRIYFYEYDGSVWKEAARFAHPQSLASAFFGMGVSISGELALVGSSSPGSTAVQEYRRIDGQWTEGRVIHSPDDHALTFGWSVEVSGDTVIVSDPSRGSEPSICYEYRLINDEWVLVDQIAQPTSNQPRGFGYTMAFDGQTLVVGSFFDISKHVQVFRRTESGWVHEASLENPQLGDQDWYPPAFGAGIEVSGDLIIVGAYGGPNGSSGSFLYERGPGGVWDLIGSMHPIERGYFGWRVAVNSTHLFVAAPEDTAGGFENAGAVYRHVIPSRFADFQRDLLVQGLDVGSFLVAYDADDPRADLDGDGGVTADDVQMFVNAYLAER